MADREPRIDEHKLAKAHRRMVDEIAMHASNTAAWTGRETISTRVMAAMARVPRHRFVPPEDAGAAYVDRPRPIGHGQTISQPFIVALMTDLLDLEAGDRVLEIGCGSGYQAAVLAELVAKVCSVEVVEALAVRAAGVLADLGYDNVSVRVGDGYSGWPEEAPFDAIVVTAAPERIPEALVRQLAPGGRLVAPLGRPHETQTLTRCAKDAAGALHCDDILPVAFVPMVRPKGAVG